MPSVKEAPATKDAAKEVKQASKDVPSSKTAPTGKDASKEISPSKTVPTSTVTPGPSAPKTLVIDRALVTLIDDNKVPATEAGMLMEVPVKEGHSVEKGDLVVAVDGEPVSRLDDVFDRLDAAPAELEVKVVRGVEERQLTVKLAREGG